MTIQFKFKLREDAPPHLYITTIKEIIEKDGYLHPTMEKLLKLMRKSRMRYIILGKVREVIVVKDRVSAIDKEYYLLERSTEPLTGYSVTYISDENIKLIKRNEKQYYKDLIDFYTSIGYDAVEETLFDDETLDTLIKTIKFPKKEK